MNRIRMFIIFSLLVCFTIGWFYIYSTTHSSGLQQFYIKNESGSDKEIKGLEIAASLTNTRMSEPLKITSAGTKYENDITFMERFRKEFGNYTGTLESYREKYRSFMRGKQNQDSFTEDSTALSYAGVNHSLTIHGQRTFSFEISVLNKKNKTVSSFKEAIPKVEKYNQVMVEDVQKNGGLLDVVTVNYVNGSDKLGAATEIHHYQFDLKAQQLAQDDTIMSAPQAEKSHTINFSKLNETSEMARHGYFVFAKDIQPMIQDNGNSPQDKMIREIYAYDYFSKKLITVPFPQVQTTAENDSVAYEDYYSGANIYFTNTKNNKLEVLTYNLGKKEDVHKWTLQLTDANPNNRAMVLINDNRLYLANMAIANGSYGELPSLDASVWVTNLDGKVLYKGEIAEKNNEDSKKYFPEINSIELKK